MASSELDVRNVVRKQFVSHRFCDSLLVEHLWLINAGWNTHGHRHTCKFVIQFRLGFQFRPSFCPLFCLDSRQLVWGLPSRLLADVLVVVWHPFREMPRLCLQDGLRRADFSMTRWGPSSPTRPRLRRYLVRAWSRAKPSAFPYCFCRVRHAAKHAVICSPRRESGNTAVYTLLRQPSPIAREWSPGRWFSVSALA